MSLACWMNDLDGGYAERDRFAPPDPLYTYTDDGEETDMNHTLPPAGLLRNAATLIERALDQLDIEHTPCVGCGAKRFRNEAKSF